MDFFADTHGFTNAKIVKETLQRPYWSIQHLLLSSASLEDTSIQFFCLFKSCSIRNALGETEFHFGGVLTNSTELLLIVGNLNWLYGGADQPPTLKYFQKFKNLVQIVSSSKENFI